MILAYRCKRSKLASRQTERASVASLATDAMTSPALDTAVSGSTTDTCLPPVAASSADDDERSLDENLRPMDGQIWLADVDGGLSDAFQTTVTARAITQ